MQVRRFSPSDFQAIANIYNESVAQGGITMDRHFYNAEDIRQWTEKFCDRETILIAEQDHSIIGWTIIKRYSDRLGYCVACETSTYLSLSETGKGYGSILQAALLKQVINFGYHHIVAKILTSNPDSIRFHQRFGFEVIGTQKEIGYYQGNWYDVAILQLVLPDVPPFCPNPS